MADPTDPILPSKIDDFVSSMRSGGHLLNSRYSVEFTSMPPIISSAVLRNFGDFRDSYTTNLIIKYLDRSDNETLGYRIREVFPKTITGIQSSADSDALTTFTVTMSFKDFSVETPPNLSGPPLSAPPPPTNPIEPGGVPPLENLGDVDALIAGL
jgi:hypothetical protein